MIFHDWSLLPTKPKTLNDYTWDEISEISASGKAASMFKVGDCKEIVLNGTVGALTFNDYHTYAFIIGFDHNASREGSNRIHFQFAKTALSGGTDICFVDSNYGLVGDSAGFRMNTSETISGGWEDSYMRKNVLGQRIVGIVNDTLIYALPHDLMDVLKTVTKYTNNTGRSTTPDAVTATTDYIFLLSEYEVFGSCRFANSNEASQQQQYAYYSAGNSKVKYQHNSTGSSACWWLRSPSINYWSSNFVNVFTSGSVSESDANVSWGVAPCFCV